MTFWSAHPNAEKRQGRCHVASAFRALWRGALLFLLAAAHIAGAATREEEIQLEYQVKAGFILNFARFVEWPANAFASPTNDLVIGILGDDPFGNATKQIEGKTIEQRTVRVKRYRDVRDAREAHLLFIAASERGRWRRIFDQLRGTSILTVSDVEGFMEAGGAINLKRKRDQVRFDINLRAAEAAGLKMSSRLLKLADSVTR